MGAREIGRKGARTFATTKKILDALPFQMAIVDKHGIIQRVNASWTGFARENGGNARISEGVGIDYLGACRMDRSPAAQRTARGIESVLDGSAKEFSCEYPCHGADQKRWFIMRVSALGGKSGGAAIAHFQITERVMAEKALKRAKRELERSRDKAIQAERGEAEFLAQMSHEIRTPLNGILGMIENLKETRLDPKQQAALGTMDSLADHLLAIVNDVLDLSKLEAGKMKVDNLPFDPNRIAEDAYSVLARTAEKKGLEFSWIRPPDFPGMVSGDGRRLRQMLLNLAGNAIKFTDKGSVRITAKARPARGGMLRLEFSIRDTGPGLDRKSQDQLFKKFRQVAGQADAKAAGTGLGLAITKNMAEAMGGTVSVKSKRGEGSDFRVSLLVRNLPVSAETQAPEPGNESAGSAIPAGNSRDWTPGRAGIPIADRGTVLIADDNEVNRKVLAAILGRLGYSVVAAKDGREALERLERSGPVAAIFLDCQMPVMDGYETANSIRLLEAGTQSNRTPIVAITADVMEANLKRCRDMGMDHLLSKPFRRADVAGLLTRLVPAGLAGNRAPAPSDRQA